MNFYIINKRHKLLKEIEKRLGVEAGVTVLGHVQRGALTIFYRVLATRFGVAEVVLLKDGSYGKMVALQVNKIVSVELKGAATDLKTVDMNL